MLAAGGLKIAKALLHSPQRAAGKLECDPAGGVVAAIVSFIVGKWLLRLSDPYVCGLRLV
jgi:hypothetical protein